MVALEEKLERARKAELRNSQLVQKRAWDVSVSVEVAQFRLTFCETGDRTTRAMVSEMERLGEHMADELEKSLARRGLTVGGIGKEPSLSLSSNCKLKRFEEPDEFEVWQERDQSELIKLFSVHLCHFLFDNSFL